MFIDFSRTMPRGYFRTLPALLILCHDTVTDTARTYGLLPDPMLAGLLAHEHRKDGDQPLPDNLPSLGRLVSDMGRHAALTYEGESTRVRLVVTEMVDAVYEGFSQRETRTMFTGEGNVHRLFDKPAPSKEPHWWLDVTDHYLSPVTEEPHYWWVRHPDTGSLVLQGKFQSAENPKAEDAVAVPALREAENEALGKVWEARERSSSDYATVATCSWCNTVSGREELQGPVHNQCPHCGMGVLPINAGALQVGSRFNRVRGGEWVVTVRRARQEKVLAVCVKSGGPHKEGDSIELGYAVSVYPV